MNMSKIKTNSFFKKLLNLNYLVYNYKKIM